MKTEIHTEKAMLAYYISADITVLGTVLSKNKVHGAY
jgi:hypothetical protein